jgi:exosortase
MTSASHMMTLMDRRGIAKVLVYSLLLIGVYYSPLQYLLRLWGNDDNSYCWFVPVVALYLIWEKRSELLIAPSSPTPVGLALCIFAAGLFWLGELGGEYYAQHFSLWLLIAALLWMHLGWNKIRTIWFALLLLLGAVPFPNVINFPLSLKLRLISSQLGVKMLQLTGMTAYREGNVIDLGFTQLQVVDACSGIRYLFPLMLLALLLAYWFKPHYPFPVMHKTSNLRYPFRVMHKMGNIIRVHWKRVVLFLSSIPIAIIVNALRIAITGMLYPLMGAAAAEGFFHDFSGWLIFMFTIPILLIEMWLLRRIPPLPLSRHAQDG